MGSAVVPFPDLPPGHLRVRGASMSIGDLRILRGVDLDCPPESITGLIGPNGAGKTTLLNCISGLYRAQSGVIQLGSMSLRGRTGHQVARSGVGRTFQAPQVVDTLSVIENVELGAQAGGLSTLLRDALALFRRVGAGAGVRDRAMAQLRRVGLADLAFQRAADCSHVERRLIEVGRALCGEPRVLLLDEPCAGMGQKGQSLLAEVLSRLAHEGITVLLVEHNVSFVMNVCASLVVLDQGEVIGAGTPDEVLNLPQVLDAYLGK